MKSIFTFNKMIYIPYSALSRYYNCSFIKLVSIGTQHILRANIEWVITALNLILSVRTTRPNHSYLPECLPLDGLAIEELFDICDHASSSVMMVSISERSASIRATVCWIRALSSVILTSSRVSSASM